jgi:hypothetical protein
MRRSNTKWRSWRAGEPLGIASASRYQAPKSQGAGWPCAKSTGAVIFFGKI